MDGLLRLCLCGKQILNDALQCNVCKLRMELSLPIKARKGGNMEGSERKQGRKKCPKCGTEANSNVQPKCKNCGAAFEKKGKYQKKRTPNQPTLNIDVIKEKFSPPVDSPLKHQVDEYIKIEKIIVAAGFLSQEKFDQVRELVRS